MLLFGFNIRYDLGYHEGDGRSFVARGIPRAQVLCFFLSLYPCIIASVSVAVDQTVGYIFPSVLDLILRLKPPYLSGLLDVDFEFVGGLMMVVRRMLPNDCRQKCLVLGETSPVPKNRAEHLGHNSRVDCRRNTSEVNSMSSW